MADDPNDTEQVALVRERLEVEAAAFRRGDLSDPAAIHGEGMPGLGELEAGHERVEVWYSQLPDGAKIEYETEDPALVRALHGWFDAQLSDHSPHAAKDGQDPAEGGGHATDRARHRRSGEAPAKRPQSARKAPAAPSSRRASLKRIPQRGMLGA